MVAKRRLNFGGSGSAKRARQDAPMVIYRGPKPEMKYFTVFPLYVSAVSVSTIINRIDQGTAVFNRIGSKVKIWHIEYVLVGDTSGASFRCDLLLNNTTPQLVTHTYDEPVDRNSQSVLRTTFFHGGTNNNARGAHIQHKLPLGIITKFRAASGSTLNSNEIVARITSPATTTITGYFRIWYTDV